MNAGLVEADIKSMVGTFKSSGQEYRYYSLPELGRRLGVPVERLPISLRIVLESVLRNCDGKKVSARDVEVLAKWNATSTSMEEIPFTVARIVLQDFTGVPLLVDLAAMRAAVKRLNKNPRIIEPLVPVDLVVDHSVQVDVAGVPQAFQFNMQQEFVRNRERYEFLKWGQQAFETFKVVPPGIGIVHQVNLEYLAQGVLTSKGVAYPDTLVGTDSHTTMINGLGIVGWGVGGIEAEAGMLGQPIYFLTPEVVGVYLTGELGEGVTATDLALTVTQILRKANVVGKFVEFYGPGAVRLPLPDRATIANMAPEYGATMGFFPMDEEALNYLQSTGRTEKQVQLVRDYFKAQNMLGIPEKRDALTFSQVIELDLGTITSSVAGPKRPQDRIELSQLKKRFTDLFSKPINENGYAKPASELNAEFALPENKSFQVGSFLKHGSVVIAAITSCTNTSNPSVMLASALLAKKAVERGLKVNPVVKASLAPGSRVVSDYLNVTDLQKYLDALGFYLVGYGCTTCIGNSGPLPEAIDETIQKHDVIAASVLSGNRNFEARVHQSIKANFLMSPPLVVAFALAGRVDIDLSQEPLGTDSKGQPVYLRDIWPSLQEIREAMQKALKPEAFQRFYFDFSGQNPAWNEIPSSVGDLYEWDEKSTYIHEPPFFENFQLQAGTIKPIENARALGIFGDSITTDHISPAGNIKKTSPAGRFLLKSGVSVEEFNSYGARRGNDLVMTRGTFANVRIKNLMVPGVEGGVTRNMLNGSTEPVDIYDAAISYAEAGVPLMVFGGKEYGSGSSRDWAAKGTRLLGVRAVIAESFERIHRSNLVGMGVLPCCFEEETNAQTLGLDGTEKFSIKGLSEDLKPRQKLQLEITRANGKTDLVPIIVRIDTPIEIDYYRHGGILPYVLRELVTQH